MFLSMKSSAFLRNTLNGLVELTCWFCSNSPTTGLGVVNSCCLFASVNVEGLTKLGLSVSLVPIKLFVSCVFVVGLLIDCCLPMIASDN